MNQDPVEAVVNPDPAITRERRKTARETKRTHGNAENIFTSALGIDALGFGGQTNLFEKSIFGGV